MAPFEYNSNDMSSFAHSLFVSYHSRNIDLIHNYRLQKNSGRIKADGASDKKLPETGSETEETAQNSETEEITKASSDEERTSSVGGDADITSFQTVHPHQASGSHHSLSRAPVAA